MRSAPGFPDVSPNCADTDESATHLREEPARFFSTITSLNNFDNLEVRNVIRGVIDPTQREVCFIGNYYRAFANIESILALNHVKHVQAVAASARGLFEIAVDVALIDRIAQGPEKMIAFVDVEKLRSAQTIIDFKTSNPDAKVDTSIFEQFIAVESCRILALRDSLWPKGHHVQHWSLMKMAKRVKQLGTPFDELYAVEYPRLSWYVHSGLTGVTNLKQESFELMAGIAFTIAVGSYMKILTAVIREFQLDKADPKILDRMDYAKMAPWTDSEQQAGELWQELGLD